MDTLKREGNVIRILEGPPIGTPKHKFGGIPEGFLEELCPRCSNCRHPLHLFLQIDTRDASLGLRIDRIPYLFVLNCLNCLGYFDPLCYKVSKDCRSIEVLSQRQSEYFGEFPPVLPERGVQFDPLPRQWAHEDERKHQLGGLPFWVQDEEVPRCKECNKPMAFLAQVDSDFDAGTQFGDMGLLYAFLCRTCSMYATFAQDY
jgi:hypothetical protein